MVKIPISLLHLKPADLDLHCFKENDMNLKKKYAYSMVIKLNAVFPYPLVYTYFWVLKTTRSFSLSTYNICLVYEIRKLIF